MAQKMIIDVDTGVDDAEAIMMALAHPDIDVVAITCVNGNTRIDQVCVNTLRVLRQCNRLDIPIYKGASVSLLGHVRKESHHHGTDGMGGVPDPDPPSINLVQEKNAVLALIDLVNKYPGEITLVALAPLTNLALAIRIDPTFGSKLKHLTIMGGNTEASGNVSPSAEFNFWLDPEAAFIVLEDIGCPIQLIGWEACFHHNQSWEWYDTCMQKYSDISPKNKFIHSINHYTKSRIRNFMKWDFYSCDPFAMGTFLDPSGIQETSKCYCTMELNGRTRGQMVVDWDGKMGKTANVELILKYDLSKFRPLYEAIFDK